MRTPTNVDSLKSKRDALDARIRKIERADRAKRKAAEREMLATFGGEVVKLFASRYSETATTAEQIDAVWRMLQGAAKPQEQQQPTAEEQGYSHQ